MDLQADKIPMMLPALPNIEISINNRMRKRIRVNNSKSVEPRDELG
jgi:hypothetical protein